MSTGPATNNGTPTADIPVTQRLPHVDDTTFENERAGTADTPPVSSQERNTTARPTDAVGDEIINRPRVVMSPDFFVHPRDVLDGAQEDNPSSVVVVYINADGRTIVGGSHGTPMVRNLLNAALREIDAIEAP